MSLAQLHSAKLLLPKPLSLSLSLSLIVSVLLLSTLWASAADPFGAPPHCDGGTPFGVWVPFVAAVAVKPIGGAAGRLAKGDGHPDPAVTIWIARFLGPRRETSIDMPLSVGE